MASKEYWMGREKRLELERQRLSKALIEWPSPRTVEQIEADEVNQPVAAQEFADPRNS